MKTKWILWFLGYFILLVCGSTAYAGSLQGTGQKKCYDGTGKEIPCPRLGHGFYGPEAVYIINRSYTKLDRNGTPLPDSAKLWPMVKDNVTGLTWEMKQNMDNVMDYANPHDADNQYTWYNSNPSTNGGEAGSKNGKRDTENFIAALNAGQFGGYADWRLPTLKELISLVNHDFPAIAINTRYFPDTKPTFYWSSTSAAISSGAWVVDFISGWDGSYYKGYFFYARAVRGGK